MRDLVLKLVERWRGAAGPRPPRGQALVIVAIAFIGLAVMVGLAIDGGILFIAQAHLRRAVDAAAVAAATQMRVGQDPANIQRFAYQFVKMNGVDPSTVLVSFYDFNNDPSGALGQMSQDCHWQSANQIDPNYDKYGLCAVPQRKLIRLEARTAAKFAFMPLMGIVSTTVTANAVSESASVDAVIVLDTSNSMGDETQTISGTVGATTAAEVAACNATALVDPKNIAGNCRPLMDAKEAAKAFVRRLYPGYDRVAIVNFDFKAHPVVITDTKPQVPITSAVFSYVREIRNPAPDGTNHGTGNCPGGSPPSYYHSECDDDPALAGSQSTGIYQAIDSIRLNYDPKPWIDLASVSPNQSDWNARWGQWNPLDFQCNWTNWSDPTQCPGHPRATSGSDPRPNPNGAYSYRSTCTGCGIRVAGNMLKLNGRPSALWIIVFLSDGGVNVSDLPGTATDLFFNPGIDYRYYPNGYCGVTDTVPLNDPQQLWQGNCVTPGKVLTPTTRSCGPYHDSLANCPPKSQWVGYRSPAYDAMDYALDMIDTTALQVNCVAGTGETCMAQNGSATDKYNRSEHPRQATGPAGANVAVYAIGLGSPVASGNAQALLRYMAAVGDDGDRQTDPCAGMPNATSCGNYYYAAKGAQLQAVFEDIAKRVFTRLSK